MAPTPYDQPSAHALDEFVARWAASSGAERANKDSFLSELCDVLAVPRPEPTTGDPEKDRYCFEKDALTTHEGGKVSTGKIDLYKDGCFILEAKQGSEAGAAKLGTAKRGTAMWALAMQAAYGQALGYAQTFDNPPPFLIVCDIGYCFDLYATFDGSRNYRDFPNAQHKRIYLRDLAAHVETLRATFLAPHTLDPAKRTTKVTRAIAEHLAELARELEAQKRFAPEDIATFLMRCIFTMFAEDAGLLPERAFTTFLEKEWIPNPDRFPDEVAQLWEKMNTGGALIGIGRILHFNGGLFATQSALPLTRKQLQLLLEASRSSWVDVEPAIFGTLLERALDPKERHALGAHFTPRSYVERLVRPTIEEPLRAEWDIVRAHVQQLLMETSDEKGARKKAVAALQVFHRRLCGVNVLDPACGTGNFLYVTLDLLKRLESEVFQLLADLGETQTPLQVAGLTVTPAQFHGIEVKRWAKEIAELVLWIGYLQWLMRTRGDAGHIPEPVLQRYGNIEWRDAVLEWDRIEPVLDGAGNPLTRWDAESMKLSPVTGENVPDETKRVPVVRYIRPRRATWPTAEFIVGNPPYIGTKRMRQALGEGYVEAIRNAYAPDVEENADFVMYWWQSAAALVRSRRAQRFGFITTNSITQTFNRRVVTQHVDAEADALALTFAIPDHPWVDSANGAAVRVAMTVGALEDKARGRLLTATSETESTDADGAATVTFDERRGPINADLTIGANLVGVEPLRANDGLCTNGVALHGQGFVVAPEAAKKLRASGASVIKRYLGGKDLLAVPRELYVIDFSFLSEEQARAANPAAFQHVLDYVKPERDHNKRDSIRERWWRFAWERPVLMKALKGLPRYIATTETAKHRVFQFLPIDVLPDHMILTLAFDDAYILGVLSSRVHVAWALGAGGRLGVGNDPRYNKSRCFDPFPFPNASDAQKARIREIAERLDAHRKAQQKAHAGLTMTGMYNVLEKLRDGSALTAKDKAIHEQGLISLLKQLHDELDAAVLDTYGWSRDIGDEELLAKLVSLNAERRMEEEAGLVRWLRPALQNAAGTSAVQTGMAETARMAKDEQLVGAAGAKPWPKLLPERIGAVRTFVHSRADAVAVADVRRAFKRAPAKDVEAALDTLASLGLLLRYESEQGKRWKAVTT
jgi:hypothetical protein